MSHPKTKNKALNEVTATWFWSSNKKNEARQEDFSISLSISQSSLLNGSWPLIVSSSRFTPQWALLSIENSDGMRERKVICKNTPVERDIKIADMTLVLSSFAFCTSNPNKIPIGLKKHIISWMKAHLLNGKLGKVIHSFKVVNDTTSDNKEAWSEIPMNIEVAFEISFCSPNVIPENKIVK